MGGLAETGILGNAPMTTAATGTTKESAPPRTQRWRPNRDGTLVATYNSCARTWQGKITRYGYMDAYASLIMAGRKFLTAAADQDRMTILDAGTGTGAFALALVRGLAPPPARIAIDLLDPSPAMLEEAMGNLGNDGYAARGWRGTIQAIPVRGPTYNVILCSHVVEHSTSPIAELSVLRSVLRPGGVLFLVASKPSWLTRLLQLRWRHSAFDEPHARTLLAAAGFVAVETFAFQRRPPSLTSMGYIALAPSQTM